MAGGSLGDLHFGLTVQDKFSKELNKLVNYLNSVDVTGRKAQEAMGLVASLVKGMGGSIGDSARAFDKVSGRIANLKSEISSLARQMSSLDTANPNDVAQLKNLYNGIKQAKKELESYKNLRDLMVNAPAEQKSPYKQPFFNENGAKDLQRVYGQAFDSLGVKADELREKIRKLSPNDDGKNWAGKALSARDLGNYESFKNELSGIERQMSSLVTLSERLQATTQGMKSATYKPFNFTEEPQKIAQRTAEIKQAYRESAEAAKKAAAEQKQHDREVYATSERIKSLNALLAKLREKQNVALNIGADTTQINQAITSIEQMLQLLKNVQTLQNSADWRTNGSLGSLGHLGTGQDVNAIRTLAQEQDKVNRKKQEAVDLERKHQQEVQRTASKVQSELVKAFQDANRSAGKMNSTLQDLKSLFLQGGLIYGAQQFLNSIIQTGGEMERQHIALQSILGDVQNANTMYGQIQELALRSPFTFSELNKDVKQLAAYGVEYENLYDTTKRLADMSAGLGVSFERIALAFGQVQARGWLDGKELRQIAYAGIPLLSKLSEMYSKREGQKVSTSDVKKRITNREVGFEDVKQIFWDMTDVGGQFYNMQEVLSQTLIGRFLKLKDAWEIMLSSFASGKSVVGGTLSWILDRTTELVQAMHELAPVVAAAFSGFALTKMSAMLGGGIGSSFLAGKSKLADDAQRRVLLGQQLSAVERNILATRNQITGSDLRSLVAARAISKVELERLFVSKKITWQQYLTYTNLIRQQAALTATTRSAFSLMGVFQNTSNYVLRIGMSVKLLLAGIANLGRSLFAMIGGLPGLALTGVTMTIAYVSGQNDKLKQDMESSMEELKDRAKTIGEFLRDNDANAIIKKGDSKEIDNTIDEYKEKLKQVAPYKSLAFEMDMAEKKSHEERLRYLQEQLELIQKANNVSQSVVKNEDVYEDFQDRFNDAKNVASAYSVARDNTKKYGVGNIEWGNYIAQESVYKEQVAAIRNMLTKELGDISKSPKLQEAANQIMSTFFAIMKWDETQAEQFRADVLSALGCKDNFYQNKFNEELSNAIDTTFPWIGNKIRNDIELTNAEKEKVRNLMKDAAANIQSEYPLAETTLQRLLRESNFTAVIHLAFSTDDTSELQKRLAGNLSGLVADNKRWNDKVGLTSRWGKGTNRYEDAESAAKKDIDEAKKELDVRRNMLSKGKISKADFTEIEDKYNLTLEAFREAFGYSYDSDKNTSKSKTTRRGSGRHKEDAELRTWRERLDAAKKFYSTYKKYKEVYGPDKALDMTKGLFPDVSMMDVTDYSGSLQKMIDTLGDGWFNKSPERKKFLTSIKESILDYDLTEVGKRKAEEFSAAFNEALEQSISQYELYKSLFEKTGNKAFASQAFKDGAVWDDSSRNLAQQFKELTGEDVDINATDTQAKHHLENIEGAYELWKKIVDLVKGKYKSSLNETADILSRNATLAEKIATINDKYDKVIKDAQQRGDGSAPEVTRRANISRRQEQNEAVYGLIPELKPLTERIWEASQKYVELVKYAEQIGDNKMLGQVKKARGAAVNDEKFKDFRKVNDLDGMLANIETLTNKTIDWLAKEIDDWLKKENLSKEVADKLVDAQGKLSEYQADKGNIFAGAKNLSQGINIGEYLKGGLGTMDTYQDVTGATRYRLSDSQAKKTGLTAGGVGYTRGQLEEAKATKTNSFENSVNKLANKFKALEQCLDPVVDLFSALGMEDTAVGQGASMVSGALGAASNASSGLGTLGLESLGPYGAAAGAVLSITSSLFAMHDKQLQKEIDASKEKQKAEEYLYQNIQDVIENTLGGVYNFTLPDSLKATLQSISKQTDVLQAIEDKYGKNSTRYKLVSAGSYYTDDTIKLSKQALGDTSNAYIGQLAALEAQRDELQHQRDLEARKKDSDSSALLEYDQQLIEAEQAVENYTTEFLDTIYGIDFKSWASDLTTAIVDAWAAGEDAADAYEDKVKDIMKDLAVNILSQKYLEDALEKSGIIDIFQNELESNGKLSEQNIKTVGDTLMNISEGAIDSITGVLDYLKEAGYDLSEDSSSSSSKSIKSITEETADLLASYINAIRADVSVNRQNVQLIAESVKVLPQMSAIASSQLTQLTQLVSLAQTRNGRLDEMYDWMRGVTNGTKKLYIA